MSEYPYITLYMPKESNLGLLGNHQVKGLGWQLKREVIDWLNSQIGTMAPTNRDWYFNLDNQNFQWLYGGLAHNSDATVVRIFYFRTQEQAMRFKLAWL